jgi:hypothetical protein
MYQYLSLESDRGSGRGRRRGIVLFLFLLERERGSGRRRERVGGERKLTMDGQRKKSPQEQQHDNTLKRTVLPLGRAGRKNSNDIQNEHLSKWECKEETRPATESKFTMAAKDDGLERNAAVNARHRQKEQQHDNKPKRTVVPLNAQAERTATINRKSN